MVLGKRNDLRSLALGSFSASMLKMIAESPVDPGVPEVAPIAGAPHPALGSGARLAAQPRQVQPAAPRRMPVAMPAGRRWRPVGRRAAVCSGACSDLAFASASDVLIRVCSVPGRLASKGGRVSETSLTPSRDELVGDVFADFRQVFRRLPVFASRRRSRPLARPRGSRRKRRVAVELDRGAEALGPEMQAASRSECREYTPWPCRRWASSGTWVRASAGLTGAASLRSPPAAHAAAAAAACRRIFLFGFLALFEGLFDRLGLELVVERHDDGVERLAERFGIA